MNSTSSTKSRTQSSDDDIYALQSAPARIARAILISLCDDACTREKALQNYHRLTKLEQQLCWEKDDSSCIYLGDVQKRGEDWNERHICLQCDEVFVENVNHFGACSYHTGKKNILLS